MKIWFIILFSVLAISILAAVTSLLFYLISRKSKNANRSFNIFLNSLAAVIFSLILLMSSRIYCETNDIRPIFVSDNQVTYDIVSEEEQVQVSVVSVAREKGKEAVYTIKLDVFGFDPFSTRWDIPASVYDEYISDGNNTITIKRDYIEMCVAEKFIFVPNGSYIFTVEKLYLPWDKQTDDSFTNENVAAFKAILVEKGGRIEESDLPFEFDCFTRGYSNDSVTILN